MKHIVLGLPVLKIKSGHKKLKKTKTDRGKSTPLYDLSTDSCIKKHCIHSKEVCSTFQQLYNYRTVTQTQGVKRLKKRLNRLKRHLRN